MRKGSIRSSFDSGSTRLLRLRHSLSRDRLELSGWRAWLSFWMRTLHPRTSWEKVINQFISNTEMSNHMSEKRWVVRVRGERWLRRRNAWSWSWQVVLFFFFSSSELKFSESQTNLTTYFRGDDTRDNLPEEEDDQTYDQWRSPQGRR